MSRAAMSVMSYGLLLALASAFCLIAAVLRVPLYGAPRSALVAYTAALALAFLSFAYLDAARLESRGAFWLSVFQRCATPGALVALVALRMAPRPLVFFGLPDFLLASWTLLALIADARGSQWLAGVTSSAPSAPAQTEAN